MKRVLTVTVFMTLALMIFTGCFIFFEPDGPSENTPEAVIIGGETEEPQSSEEAGIATPEGGDIPTEEPFESPTEEPSPTKEQPTEEQPLKGLVIGIDPGHQAVGNFEKEPCAPWGPDKNATVNNEVMKTKTSSGTEGRFSKKEEYVLTLEISLKIRDKLEKLGAKVVMTRETHDVNLSNIDRAVIGNEAGCDVMLRIHANGIDNESVNGVETWVRGRGDGSEEYIALGEYEKKLSEELLDCFVRATGAKRRYANTSDNYTGLNWSTVPSIILECGFMSNEIEDLNMSKPEYQEKIAEAVAEWLKTSSVLKR